MSLLGAMVFILATSQSSDYRVDYNGWAVRSRISTCHMAKEFERGIAIYIEYDERRDEAVFAIGDPSFKSIKDGETYNLNMDLVLKDGQTALYEVRFTGRVGGDFNTISARMPGKQFLDHFEQTARVKVRRGEISVSDIDVSYGSGGHIWSLRRCSALMAKENPSDPFSN